MSTPDPAHRHRGRDALTRLAAWAPPLSTGEGDALSQAPVMRPLLEIAARSAPATVPILICGESGAGKEVLARAIHAQGPRKRCRFVTIDCPALVDGLAPGEPLTEAGGTPAPSRAAWHERLARADGGTLFLDEVGDLPAREQAKLLGLIQDHPVADGEQERPRRLDVRIIAATSRDLGGDVGAQRFRSDLLFRLNTIELRVPPLRDRPEDILPLARGFLATFGRLSGRGPLSLSPEAESALLAYAWPGNVRELRNAIERAVILCLTPVVGPADLPERVAGVGDAGPRVGGPFTLDQLEQAHIQAVLAQARTMEQAATLLGIDASTLWRKRRRLDRRNALDR